MAVAPPSITMCPKTRDADLASKFSRNHFNLVFVPDRVRSTEAAASALTCSSGRSWTLWQAALSCRGKPPPSGGPDSMRASTWFARLVSVKWYPHVRTWLRISQKNMHCNEMTHCYIPHMSVVLMLWLIGVLVRSDADRESGPAHSQCSSSPWRCCTCWRSGALQVIRVVNPFNRQPVFVCKWTRGCIRPKKKHFLDFRAHCDLGPVARWVMVLV